MAYGDITKAAIGTLAIDATAGSLHSVLHIAGDVFAVAYQDAANDGWLKTFTCTIHGTFGSILSSLEFDTVDGREVHLIHASGTTYILVYQGADFDGFIKTVTIQDDGTIGSVLDTWEFDSASAEVPKILHISGTVYAIFCNGGYNTTTGDDSYWLKTLNIATDGTITKSFIDSLIQDFGISTCNLLRGRGNYFITGFTRSSAVYVQTVHISNAGVIGDSVTSSLTIDASGDNINVFELATGYFCAVYRDTTAGHGFFTTFSVSTSGVIASIASKDFHGPTCYSPMGVTLGDTMRVVVFRDGATQNPAYIVTWEISNVGVIAAAYQDIWTFNAVLGTGPQLIHVKQDIWMIVYSKGPGEALTLEISTPGAIYPSDDMVRVTNLIHRYNRKQGVYELEMALGEVTSDFGLPQWLTAAMSAAPRDRTQDIIQEVITELSRIPYTPGAPMPNIPPAISSYAPDPGERFPPYTEIPITSARMTPQYPRVGMDPFNRSGWEIGPGRPRKREEKKWWEFWK